MSFAASAALQVAVYQALCGDAALTDLVGDAVYDAMPVAAPTGTYIALGPEELRDAGDMTGAGAWHDFTISVLSGTEDGSGFALVKKAASAVCQALEGSRLQPAAGHLVGVWFQRAKARRVENGAGRRVDLIFRARMDLA